MYALIGEGPLIMFILMQTVKSTNNEIHIKFYKNLKTVFYRLKIELLTISLASHIEDAEIRFRRYVTGYTLHATETD